MKHTPAPWVAKSDPCHYDTISSIVGGFDELRVEVGGFSSVETKEANTRLIAAAPVMLDALIAIRRSIYGDMPEALKLTIQNAINQAIGENN